MDHGIQINPIISRAGNINSRNQDSNMAAASDYGNLAACLIDDDTDSLR